jgi:hypothetical protein
LRVWTSNMQGLPQFRELLGSFSGRLSCGAPVRRFSNNKARRTRLVPRSSEKNPCAAA